MSEMVQWSFLVRSQITNDKNIDIHL
jgi:hypothetical protein